jgi:hypothetical protein
MLTMMIEIMARSGSPSQLIQPVTEALEFPDKDTQSVQNVQFLGFPASLCVE